MLADNGQQYLERYGKDTKGAGWFSFDHRGAHFVALVNTINLQKLGHTEIPVRRKNQVLIRDLHRG